MGARATKLFQTLDSNQKMFKPKCETLETKDPRSPDVLRTPLNELNVKSDKNEYQDCFRDPRSPTTCISRTPIVFESDQSKSFVFEEEDTFSELFTTNPNPKKKSNEIKTTEVDPRSPTVEINRTPLVFDESISLELPPITFSDVDDEEEENEDELIQSVLDLIKLNVNEKPKNKQIERVKNLHKKKLNKNSKNNNKQQVYQDSNVFYSTPKKNTFIENKIDDISQNKRTPLGCVENKLRVRSRSAENIKNKNGRNFGSNYFDENISKPTKHISVFETESENSSFII